MRLGDGGGETVKAIDENTWEGVAQRPDDTKESYWVVFPPMWAASR